MKVRELMARLSHFNPEFDVAFEDDDGYCEPQVYLSPIVREDGTEGVVLAISAFLEPEWAISEEEEVDSGDLN